MHTTYYLIFALVIGAGALALGAARAHLDSKDEHRHTAKPDTETFDAHKRERIALNLARRNDLIRTDTKVREFTR